MEWPPTTPSRATSGRARRAGQLSAANVGEGVDQVLGARGVRRRFRRRRATRPITRTRWWELELHAAAAGEVHRVAGIEAAEVGRDGGRVVDDRSRRAVRRAGRAAIASTSPRWAPPTRMAWPSSSRRLQ